MGAAANLITLALFLGFVGGFAYIGYQMYLYSTELADRGQKHMAKKNINFGSDGVKVGVRQMDHEEYSSRTQNAIVNAWNLSSWPAYKSMLWNQNAEINKRGSSAASPAPPPSSSTGDTLRPAPARGGSSFSTIR